MNKIEAAFRAGFNAGEASGSAGTNEKYKKLEDESWEENKDNLLPAPGVPEPYFGPSLNGSKNCKSGSIASGGSKSHCSCDVCF